MRHKSALSKHDGEASTVTVNSNRRAGRKLSHRSTRCGMPSTWCRISVRLCRLWWLPSKNQQQTFGYVRKSFTSVLAQIVLQVRSVNDSFLLHQYRHEPRRVLSLRHEPRHCVCVTEWVWGYLCIYIMFFFCVKSEDTYVYVCFLRSLVTFRFHWHKPRRWSPGEIDGRSVKIVTPSVAASLELEQWGSYNKNKQKERRHLLLI